MNDWFKRVQHYASAHPWLPIGGAALGLVVVATLVWLGVRAARGRGRDRVISALINVAALMATSVQASGMWKFFGATMGLPVGFRIFMFSFMEIALLACGLRARANVEEGGDAGIDGVLVWVLAIASGLMSSTEANSPQEALMRVLVSVVVALLWTRDLMAAKQGARKAGGLGRRSEKIRWRLGVSAIAVKLRLADATDHGLADRDANRRIDAFVMAAHTANSVPDGSRSAERAERRRARAHAKLMRHARLHADPTHLMNLLGKAAFDEALELLGIAPEEGDGMAGVEDTAIGSRPGGRRTVTLGQGAEDLGVARTNSRPIVPENDRLTETLARAEREIAEARANGWTSVPTAESRGGGGANGRAAAGATANGRGSGGATANGRGSTGATTNNRASAGATADAQGAVVTPNGRSTDSGSPARPGRDTASATRAARATVADSSSAEQQAPALIPSDFDDEPEGIPAPLPGQRILAERVPDAPRPAEAAALVPSQRAAAGTRPATLAVVSPNRTTAIAGALKSPKDTLFALLDALHAAGDERLHSGDPRRRNETALELADSIGHKAAPRTIQRQAKEWAQLKNPDAE